MIESVEAKLEIARRELLDLGLRNPLLNYRPLRARGIEVVDERPAEVFRILVSAGRTMYFTAGAEGKSEERGARSEERGEEGELAPAAGAGTQKNSGELKQVVNVKRDGGSGEEPAWSGEVEAAAGGNGVTLRQLDVKLQTPYQAAELDKRLLNTYYAARTYLEEQGVNVLYLALGMLNWYEAGNSDIPRQAPLILIPVQLDRADVYTRFRLRYTEEEIGDNVSLRAKLKAEFSVNLPPFPESEGFDVTAYLQAVSQAVRPLARWSVDEGAIALGFFSFAAFLMYHDLQPGNWPAGANAAEHPILNALLHGHFKEPPSRFEGEVSLDGYLLPPQSHQVVDADSSQTVALLDAAQGRNLVIQGPPGTGKSQTITNLIAEAIAQDKTVLFVAEKMAALEVVKRRLDQAGIGDACLELHSHKTNKKSVLNELRRTLALGRPAPLGQANFDAQLLKNTQQTLNRTSAALNMPIGRSDVTPFQAFGELMNLESELPDAAAPDVNLAGIESWTAAEFGQLLAVTTELQTLLGRLGLPAQHPFWGSGRRVLLPADQRQLQQASQTGRAAVLALQQAGRELAAHLGLPAGANRPGVEQRRLAAQRALDAPPLAGIAIPDEGWLSQGKTIVAAVTAGARLAELRQQYSGRLIPEAWQQNVLTIRQALLAYGRQWWRWVSGPYRQARRELAGLLNGPLPKSNDEQLALVEAILEAQRLRPVLAAQETVLARLFGRHWRGADDSDWDHLTAATNWLVETHRLIQEGGIPAALLDYIQVRSNDFSRQTAEAVTTNQERVRSNDFSRSTAEAVTTNQWKTLRALAGAVDERLVAHRQTIAAVVGLLQLDEKVRFGGRLMADLRFDEQVALLDEWQAELGRLQEIVAWNHLADRLAKQAGPGLVALAAHWPEGGNHLVRLARRAWYEGLLAGVMAQRPELAAFEGQIQQQRIQTFCNLDRQLFRANRLRLAEAHWQRLPRHAAGGQLGVLQREFEKKSRHLPIRQLMQRAGNAIQAIKPVFMMSPLSIAMFLPMGSVQFDLVVFDEASQVQPVEAFGAILRGRQAVVVGDSRQLPPTTFFTRLLQAEEDEDSPTADMESILGLFAAQGAPQRMLRWHYRSKHESLIAVSNQEFYENRLVVFPSPDAARQDVGLTYRHLPDTFYQRGGSRTNPGEAEAVAEAVMAHARSRPDQTLGVAAFSVGQMQAILDRLEALRRRDPTCESFFNAHPEEPFFVKNLENVQGDERDVIYISIGYGRAADGTVAHNFGPLNQAGGERRLNVLITRARLRCEVFTNLLPEDIDLGRTNAAGVKALKLFLAYAQSGRLKPTIQTKTGGGGETDSTFEEAVAVALRGHGYRVEEQIGTAGFFVDLAVVDEAGRYLLGITCDGANYHSARTARDRDRLRQQVLEGLGWQIVRIWSADWFQNPKRELQKLVEVIEVTRQREMGTGSETGTQGNLPSQGRGEELLGTQEVERQTAAAAPPADLSLPEYQPAQLVIGTGGRSLADLAPARLAGYVQQIVEIESPVHLDEVVRRVAGAAGLQRLERPARRAIEQAISEAVKLKLVQRRGHFLWQNGLWQVTARSRAGLPANSRKIELIAPEELAAAIRHLVGAAWGMRPEEIPAAVVRLFGFTRLTADARQQVEELLVEMVAQEQLVRQGEFVVVGSQA